jgi:hypothetical protein
MFSGGQKSVVFLGLTLVFLFFALPSELIASAEVLKIEPVVLDESAALKQNIDKVIKLRNESDRKVEFYAVPQEIGERASSSGETLLTWLEFGRGVISLEPGAEKDLPLKINISPNALPGLYHAQIIFAPGSNRWDAESLSKSAVLPRLLLNLRIEAKVIEKIENAFFKTKSLISTGRQVDFAYRFKNIGNQPLTPAGIITIYRRNGSETASILVNPEKKAMEPNSEIDFLSAWPIDGGRLGKFKAKFDVRYGKDGNKAINDTIYFWVLPYWFIYSVGLILLALIITMLVLFYKLRRQSAELYDQGRDQVINLKKRLKH